MQKDFLQPSYVEKVGRWNVLHKGNKSRSNPWVVRESPSGRRWIVKEPDTKVPYRVASETIAARLATKVKMPVPDFQLQPFGHHPKCFFTQYVDAVPYFEHPQRDALCKRDDFRQCVSRMLPFDLFICNTDRHRKNFLVGRDTTRTLDVYLIDHDGALLDIGGNANRFKQNLLDREPQFMLKDAFGELARRVKLYPPAIDELVTLIEGIQDDCLRRLVHDLGPSNHQLFSADLADQTVDTLKQSRDMLRERVEVLRKKPEYRSAFAVDESA